MMIAYCWTGGNVQELPFESDEDFIKKYQGGWPGITALWKEAQKIPGHHLEVSFEPQFDFEHGVFSHNAVSCFISENKNFNKMLSC